MREKFFNFLKFSKLEIGIIIFLLILFVFSTIVRADSVLVDTTTNYPVIEDSIVCDYLNEKTDVIIWQDDSQIYNLIVWSNVGKSDGVYPYAKYDTTDMVFTVSCCPNYNQGTTYPYYHFKFNESSEEWELYDTVEDDKWNYIDLYTYEVVNDEKVEHGALILSTMDLHIGSSDETIFFQQTPLSQKTELVVAGMTAQELTLGTLKQIVGLLPLVIGLVILAIALKKGITMLFQRLRLA